VSRSRPGTRNSVTVEIAGERHVLRSDAPPEYTHAVAAHVDATIRSLGPAASLEPQRMAVLAAMVITDELFRAREELRALQEEVERRASLLADRLERAGEEREPAARGGAGA
jgi:cell division protein ZapA